MEQLIELLKQIQELAGAGIDALKQVSGGGEGAPDKGAPPEGGKPGGGPEDGNGPPEGAEGEKPQRFQGR